MQFTTISFPSLSIEADLYSCEQVNTVKYPELYMHSLFNTNTETFLFTYGVLLQLVDICSELTSNNYNELDDFYQLLK